MARTIPSESKIIPLLGTQTSKFHRSAAEKKNTEKNTEKNTFVARQSKTPESMFGDEI
jgi:hypothetical protein